MAFPVFYGTVPLKFAKIAVITDFWGDLAVDLCTRGLEWSKWRGGVADLFRKELFTPVGVVVDYDMKNYIPHERSFRLYYCSGNPMLTLRISINSELWVE